jgi:porphobilinogen deaminase
MSRTITVGTRGSKLALAQTEAVIAGLRDVSQGMDIGMRVIASSNRLV